MKKMLSFLELLIPAIMLVFMVIVVCVQVFMRYVMKSPLSWPEEVTRWCLIWITFVGLSYGAQHEALVRVDFFVKKFFPNRSGTIVTVVDGVVTLFFAYLFVSACAYTAAGIGGGKTMPVTGVPTAVSNVALAAGALLIVLHGAVDLLHRLRSDGHKEA